jgi:hypothetical protein
VFQCPSDPAPLFLESGQITDGRNEVVLFDALHPADHFAPYEIRNFVLPRLMENRSQHPGAWYGTTWANTVDSEYKQSPAYTPARLQRIVDGLSKTILVAERAGGAYYRGGEFDSEPMPAVLTWLLAEEHGMDVPWAAPSLNLTNRTGIFSFHHGGAHVAMCEGSVRFLAEDIEPRVLGALLIRDDGLQVADF